MSTANADGLVPVEATVASIFYRRPSPAEPPFVEEGDQVNEDTVVCLLEIMKCFRSVAAEVKGTVEKILVESGDLVQKGNAVMFIRPDK
jgi:acetyl-CoA carboxylase biotin carboxyl carrier protein